MGSTERCGHRQVWAYVLTPWATAILWARAYLVAPPSEVVEHDERGLGDGEKPDVAFKPAGAAPDADHIAAELDLCVASAGWVPWTLPSAQLV